MENFSHLHEQHRILCLHLSAIALDKLTALVGIDQINHILTQIPEGSLEVFIRYEIALIGQVYDHVALAMPTRCITVTEAESKARPFTLSVKPSRERKGKISSSGSER